MEENTTSEERLKPFYERSKKAISTAPLSLLLNYPQKIYEHALARIQNTLETDPKAYLLVPDKKKLTQREAETLSDFEGDFLFLNDLTSLSPQIAEILATCNCESIHFNRLQSISDEALKALSKFEGELCFNEIESLNEEQAEILSTFLSNSLQLNGVSKLTPKTAEWLASWEGEYLELFGLEELPKSVSLALCFFKGFLFFKNELAPVFSEHILGKMLRASAHYLEETELKKILKDFNPESQENTFIYFGFILDAQEEPSEYLFLTDCSSLSLEKANRLRFFDGEGLMLNSIQNLEPDRASALAKFQGSYLQLNGLKKISGEVAQELGNADCGFLCLDGLAHLEQEQLVHLAKFEGVLSLSGLKTLSSEFLEMLPSFQADILHLNGLSRINPDTAASLALFKGEMLGLEGLKKMGVATAKHLSKIQTERLGLIRLKEPSDEVIKALAQFLGEIDSNPQLEAKIKKAKAEQKK